VEKTDGVQRKAKEVTGTWGEGLAFAFLAILYMIAVGYAMNAR
jgi:hypothetical protein